MSKDLFESIGSRDNRSYKLCKKFDKLNVGVVTNTEIREMEVDSTLL
jgi:hypothetical protein